MRLKDGPGSWQPLGDRFQYRLRVAGKVRSKVVSSHEDGRLWIKAQRLVKAKLDLGIEVPERGERPTCTFGEVAPLYLKHLREVGSLLNGQPLTQAAYTTASTLTRLALEEGWDGQVVARTTQLDVDRYVAGLRNRGLSPSSIRGRLGRLSQLIRYALRLHWIGKAPVQIKLPPKTVVSPPPAVSEADLDVALGEALGRSRLAVLLAGDAGLRRKEIARLRRCDVTLQAAAPPARPYWGWIKIANLSETERTKSGRERSVPILTRRLYQALRERGADWSTATPILGTSSDTTVRTLVERAGLKCHALRRRFATACIKQGVDPETLRQWMGHALLSTTQAYLRVGAEPSRPVDLEAPCQNDVLERVSSDTQD